MKLPENLRAKAVSFRELCDDALAHSRAENSEKQSYELRLRIKHLLPVFSSRPAEAIRKNEIVSWLGEQAEARNWAASSRNRWQAAFSLIFRVGMDNEEIDRNPAARIWRKTEGHGRVRFLSDGEEARLRVAILGRFPEFLPHLELAIHTGMRMCEQYSLRWNQVDFERRQLHLPKTKNGDPRTIPLNAIALGALKRLRGAARESKRPIRSFRHSAPVGRFRGRRAGSRLRLKRRRLRATPGIATAIRLPVDWLWPEWICGRLQSCSGIGRSRW